MMITPALRTFACCALLAVPAGLAAASDDPPSEDLFARAMEAAGERSPAAGAVCGFIAEPSWSEGGAFRYEVDSEAGGHWRGADGELLEERPEGLPENGDNLIGFVPERVFASQEPPRFVRWQDGLAIYQLRPVNVPLSGGGFSFDIADNVIGEAAIDPQTGRFVYRTIRAPESFRPSIAVRIREYETGVEFAPAWEGGPLVVTGTRYAINASAMMRTFDMGGENRYADFRPCEAG